MSLKQLDDTADKGETELSEYAPQAAEDLAWANRDDVDDLDRKGGLLGYFLKKNPSPGFIADVATMNETVLDPKEVAQKEKSIVCGINAVLPSDKTTLSYAAIFDIKKDLNLGTSQYSWLSSLFYFGWLAWALPTNMMMQKFPLNKYLAANIFFWGLFLMLQAASRNFTDLAILRTISGAAEGIGIGAHFCLWPDGKIILACVYSANGVGIALGGLLGFAIGNSTICLDSYATNWPQVTLIKGLPSWKYEFLIIGALCCGWAIFMLIFIPDSPYQTRWFTRAERLIIVSRKRDDQNGTDNRHWDASQALEAFMDIKTYLFFLFGFTANVPNGGTSNFGTLIIKGFGFNTLNTTLMQLPYGAIIVAFIVGALIANSKIPKGNRTYLMVATNIPTVVGFAMVAWAKPKAARLIGFWITGASNATFVVGLSLVSGNVGGQTKKAMASAAVFLGVAAGNIKPPTYITGVVGCMVSRILEIVVILALRIVFSRANAKRDRAVAEGRVEYDERLTTLQDISDWKNPAFRYVL
ncbi:MFS general substrate transporter [Mycena sanguinolenta]|uniref:MFS general substrate transporter n=1 Tax=Mycena sanguinolenta TaxID=230812 RepID=A0A8H6Z5V1_9AGAR|nr:MFS general substrate transporter [Mycena sanguinolenta]